MEIIIGLLPGLITVLISAVLVFLIFLIFREVMMWYWKINKIVDLLEKIEIGIDFLATDRDQKNSQKVITPKSVTGVNSKQNNTSTSNPSK